MSHTPQLIALRPESEEELRERAERWLRVAGVWGSLPTPITPLYDAAKVVERDMLELVPDAGFRERLLASADAVKAAWQKVLGVADLRKKVVYIARDTGLLRQRFTQLHEFAHQTIPWHDVNLRYKDTAHELGRETKKEFEREAN